MKRLILTPLLLMTLIGCARAAELDDRFIDAIHQVDSGGSYTNHGQPIIGDHGKALGPFQIHFEYWADSGIAQQPDKYPHSYERCAHYYYAIRTMTAYLNKYAPEAVKNHDYETLAKVHHNGPSGINSKSARAYWKRVKNILDN